MHSGQHGTCHVVIYHSSKLGDSAWQTKPTSFYLWLAIYFMQLTTAMAISRDFQQIGFSTCSCPQWHTVALSTFTSIFPMSARIDSRHLKLIVLFQLQAFVTWNQSKTRWSTEPHPLPCWYFQFCFVLPVTTRDNRSQSTSQGPPVRSEAFQQCITVMHPILAKLFVGKELLLAWCFS